MYENSPLTRKNSGKNLCQCVILLAALLTGCGDESRKDPSQTVTPETAQLISAVTSGTVASRDVIKAPSPVQSARPSPFMHSRSGRAASANSGSRFMWLIRKAASSAP